MIWKFHHVSGGFFVRISADRWFDAMNAARMHFGCSQDALRWEEDNGAPDLVVTWHGRVPDLEMRVEQRDNSRP